MTIRKKRFLLLMISSLLSLLLCEIVLRYTLVPIESEYPYEQGAFVADDDIGYRLKPNHRSIMTNGFFHEEVVTNANGLRDHFNEQYPDPGIVAIGDSQTFGYGIAAKNSWPEQLQRKIRLNVVNAGVGGYAITQYKTVLERLIEKRDISYVLYAMSWNDVYSGGAARDTNTVVNGYIVSGDNSELTLKNRIRLLKRRTALGVVTFDFFKTMAGNFGIKVDPAEEQRLMKAVELTKAELAKLDDFLKKSGIKLIVVHLANANFVIPEFWENYSKIHSHSRYFAHEHLADFCKEREIVFRDATDALTEKYLVEGGKRTTILLPVNLHYNTGANDTISDIFMEILAGEAFSGNGF